MFTSGLNIVVEQLSFLKWGKNRVLWIMCPRHRLYENFHFDLVVKGGRKRPAEKAHREALPCLCEPFPLWIILWALSWYGANHLLLNVLASGVAKMRLLGTWFSARLTLWLDSIFRVSSNQMILRSDFLHRVVFLAGVCKPGVPPAAHCGPRRLMSSPSLLWNLSLSLSPAFYFVSPMNNISHLYFGYADGQPGVVRK